MSRLFHFILSHSIFISFCAAALSLQTLLLLSVNPGAVLLSFIFFATLSGYNAYWIISRFSFNTYISAGAFLGKIKSSLVVIFVALAGMLYCMGHLHLVMYNVVITFALLSMYALPLLPIRWLHFTRKAGFVKTLLLALAWTMVTTLIPLQVVVTDMNRAEVLLFINRFLFMLMLCIIFDKRDAAMDKIRGLQSLATDIRPTVLNYLIAGITVAYILVSILLGKEGVNGLQVASLLAMALITPFVYILSIKKRGYVFYYFLVDGLMFLSGLLTLLASI